MKVGPSKGKNLWVHHPTMFLGGRVRPFGCHSTTRLFHWLSGTQNNVRNSSGIVNIFPPWCGAREFLMWTSCQCRIQSTAGRPCRWVNKSTVCNIHVEQIVPLYDYMVRRPAAKHVNGKIVWSRFFQVSLTQDIRLMYVMSVQDAWTLCHPVPETACWVDHWSLALVYGTKCRHKQLRN